MHQQMQTYPAKKIDLPETGFFFSLLCMIVSTMKCFDKADVWLHLLADGVISKHKHTTGMANSKHVLFTVLPCIVYY